MSNALHETPCGLDFTLPPDDTPPPTLTEEVKKVLIPSAVECYTSGDELAARLSEMIRWKLYPTAIHRLVARLVIHRSEIKGMPVLFDPASWDCAIKSYGRISSLSLLVRTFLLLQPTHGKPSLIQKSHDDTLAATGDKTQAFLSAQETFLNLLKEAYPDDCVLGEGEYYVIFNAEALRFAEETKTFTWGETPKEADHD